MNFGRVVQDVDTRQGGVRDLHPAQDDCGIVCIRIVAIKVVDPDAVIRAADTAAGDGQQGRCWGVPDLVTGSQLGDIGAGDDVAGDRGIDAALQ